MLAAYPFTPNDFNSLGDFTAAGAVSFDTDALTFGGSPGGVADSGIAVFTFDTLTIPAGASITAKGSRPIALLANNSVEVGGTINVDGANAINFTVGPFAGGAGGGAGGAGGSLNPQNPGAGPGGGGSGFESGGAGGGGFGGAGGSGGNSPPGAGGVIYGNLAASLQAGSGGGSGGSSSASGGGGGGGGLLINTAVGITILSGGTISANGGSGSVSGRGASGGGSGGGIVLVAPHVTSNGVVRANGGNGGAGGCCGAGGGGGGGKILVAATSSGIGVYTAAGGINGLGGGGFEPGQRGTDGATGVITFDPFAFNRPPMANANGPYEVAEGGIVTLNGSGSDPDGNPITFEWDLDGDGIFAEVSGARGNETLQSPVFSAGGLDGPSTYVVGLRTRDTKGAVSPIDNATIHVRNVAPTLSGLALSDTDINEGESTTLSGTIADAGSADTFTVEIDWDGDGAVDETHTGVAAGAFSYAHTYADDDPTGTPSDTYTIGITVTDDDGGSVSGVDDGTDVLWVGSGSQIWNDGSYSVTQVNLSTFGGLSLSGFDVIYVDGSAGNPTSRAADIDAFVQAGGGLVTESGGSIGSANFSWAPNGGSISTVTEHQNTVLLTALGNAHPMTAGMTNADLSNWGNSQHNYFTATAGMDILATRPAGDANIIVDEYGAGRLVYLGVDPACCHQNHAGARELIRRAISWSGSAAEALTVTVNNVAPVANAGADQTVDEGDLVTLNGTFTDQGTDDGHKEEWSVVANNGQVVTGPVIDDLNGDSDGSGASSFSFTPADNGTYTVTYTVTDDDGGTHTDTAVITVENLAPTAVGDFVTVSEDSGANEITVLDNDSDPAGVLDPLTIVSATDGANGLVIVGDDGLSLTYTPNPDFFGTDSFTYTISDGDGGTATATVTVTVLNVVDISGRVFDDRDNDGAFDMSDGDEGLGGVVVQLVDESSGVVVAAETTDSDGEYEFDFGQLGLSPGNYTIRQASQPAGYLDGKESVGTLGGVVDNLVDSNTITGIVIGQPGSQGDSDGYDFAELLPASLQGLVWEDFDDDGEVDLGEMPIDGATITLTGTDDRGTPVGVIQATDLNGFYEFAGLRPGAYQIDETQPTSIGGVATDFVDGQDTLGEVLEPGPEVVLGDDGVVGANDQFANIELVAGSAGVNYNFGERIDGGALPDGGVTAGIGFWQNKNGQALIASLNGGPDSTLLSEYLSTTFPNMYGGLAGLTNTDVAEEYKHLFKRNGKTSPGGPPKLDAQVMAVAFATYVTKESFVSVDFATNMINPSLVAGVEAFGFTVSLGGVGSMYFNVGDGGAAFGVADDEEVRIIDLLLATDSMSLNGLLYDDADSDGVGDGEIDGFEKTLRTLANDVFSAINEHGDI